MNHFFLSPNFSQRNQGHRSHFLHLLHQSSQTKSIVILATVHFSQVIQFFHFVFTFFFLVLAFYLKIDSRNKSSLFQKTKTNGYKPGLKKKCWIPLSFAKRILKYNLILRDSQEKLVYKALIDEVGGGEGTRLTHFQRYE